MAESENLSQLGQIREEVDAALMTARIALVTSSDIAAIQKRLPICVEQLQQVRGAMDMVQLSGAVMVLDEMLQLTQALEAGQVALPRPAVDALIHALLQLPVYLEQLEGGGADSPYVTQPLIEELRAARGASPLTQELLFSPELDIAEGDISPVDDGSSQMKSLAGRLRPIYERALLEWMRQPAEEGYLKQLSVMLRALVDASSMPVTRQLFEIAEAVLHLLEGGHLQPEKSLYQLLGKLNLELKRLVGAGEAELQGNPPEELMRRLLYHIARVQGGGEKVDLIRERYRLDQALPSGTEISRAHAGLSGPDRGSVQSALSALRGEMGSVKRALEELLRDEILQGGKWLEVVNKLKQFATTLEFLGLEVSAGYIRQQVDMLQPVADGQQVADESFLMEVAKNLLMIESVLRGGVEETALAAGNAADGALLTDGEFGKLRREACSEVISALNRLKATFENTSSNMQRREVLPALEMVGGALEMLELHEAAGLIRICYRYIDSTVSDTRQLQQRELESAAELITAVEICVEAVAAGQADAERLLEPVQATATLLDESIARSDRQPVDEKRGDNDRAIASIIKASMSSAGVETELKTVIPESVDKTPEPENEVLAVEKEAAGELSCEESKSVEKVAAEEELATEEKVAAEEEATAEEIVAEKETTVDDPEQGSPERESPAEKEPAPVQSQSSYVPGRDPVLLDIFAQEVREHLTAIRGFVARAETTEEPEEINAELHRVLHTLHGSALTAEIPDIATLAGQLENHIGKLVEKRLSIQGGLLQLLEDSCNSIEAMLVSLSQSGMDVQLDDKESFLARIDALDVLLEANPEPEVELTPEQKAEAELRQVFSDECDEILERYQQHLQQWQEDKTEIAPLQALERELHTLKGSARVAGIGAIADISHVLESLLSEVLAERMEPSGRLFELLEEACERLSMMVEQVKAGHRPEDLPELIRQVREFVAGSRGIVQQESAQEDDEPPPAQGQIVRFPTPGSGRMVAVEVLADNLRQMPQLSAEQFRVRADLMDNLVNVAGEAGVYRSRIGQQVEGAKNNIEELHRTVERLREQLRRLDIETESRILSRHGEAEELSGEQFDPLELDRFSRKQTLARSIMESLNDLTSLENLLADQIKQSEILLQQQGKATQELQDVLNRARLQSFSSYLPRLHRVVQQAGKELGKEVELYVEGAEQELDRSMLAHILPSIEHILRNAVTHGIEMPSVRSKAGKPEKGQISIQLERHGADMLVRINDDGAGLDLERIRRKGIEAGYIHPSTPFTEEQAVQFIQRAGFSTADSVTQLAGRGVGLDVVKSETRQLGGTVQVRSWQGEGMQFTLRLPLIHYLSSALLVQVDTETYALPPMGIEGITRIEGAQIIAREKECEIDSYVECMGQSYRIEILADLVGARRPHRYREDRHYIVVLLRVAEHRLAVVVDKVAGEREIMMKSFGPQLSRVKGIPGAAFMDDGSAVMILDLAALIESTGLRYKGGAGRLASRSVSRHKVLVVDDSITVRCVMSQFLERHEIQVLTAKDGMEAIPMLDKQRPDVILLDVEMPHMNGYELTRYIRNDARLKNIPIIMITSRSGEKHRQKALALGVEAFLSKPYREDELLKLIQQMRTPNRLEEGG